MLTTSTGTEHFFRLVEIEIELAKKKKNNKKIDPKL